MGVTSFSRARCRRERSRPAAGFDLDAALQVLVELGVERGDDVVVDEQHVDLLVEVHRARVQVGGPDVGQPSVDGHHLGVQHRRLEVPEPDPAVEQCGVLGLSRELDEALVGVRTGQQDVDLDPPFAGGAEAVRQLLVGDEVGRGDPDTLLRQLEQRPEHRRHVAPARLGGAPDALDHGGPGLGLIREAVDRLVEELGLRLGPVVQERGAQAVHGRTLDAEVGIAPLRLVAGIAPPAVGDADTPGEADRLVGDEHLAMRAMVHLTQAQAVERAEPVDLGPGALHAVDHRLVHGVRAPGVEEHADAHTGAGAFGEMVAHLLADLAGPSRRRSRSRACAAPGRSPPAWRGRSRRRCATR